MYYRLLAPGTYEIQASANGYEPQSRNIVVEKNERVAVNFELKKRK